MHRIRTVLGTLLHGLFRRPSRRFRLIFSCTEVRAPSSWVFVSLPFGGIARLERLVGWTLIALDGFASFNQLGFWMVRRHIAVQVKLGPPRGG